MIINHSKRPVMLGGPGVPSASVGLQKATGLGSVGLVGPRRLSYLSPLSGGGVISRNFTNLAAVSGKYYAIDPVVLEVGDKIQITFQAPTSTPNTFTYLISDSVSTERTYVVFTNTGSFTIRNFGATMLLDGNSVSTSSVVPIDGQLHVLELTCSDVDSPITSLGLNNAILGQFYNGILADFKHIRGANTLLDIPLNESWVNSNVVHDLTTVLGPELVTNGSNPINTSGWSLGNVDVTIIDGYFVLETTGANPHMYQSFPTVIGATYVFTYEFKLGTEVAFSQHMRLGAGEDEAQNYVIFPPEGVTTFAFVATTSTTTMSFGYGAINNGNTSLWRNLSVKRADGYGQAINIIEADSELFTLNTATSPDQWENFDQTRIIPIAGT